MSSGGAGKISHQVITGLYHALSWYRQNRGAGKAAVVLNYYDMWKSLHALTVNISDDAWREIRERATSMGIRLGSREDDWLFLFAIETYLHLFVRAITLSKLGNAPQDLPSMQRSITYMRSIFAPSVFEWVFEAYNDKGLHQDISSSLKQSIDSMLKVLYNLNIATLSVDVFRELYQNILPKSLRRSLGEFYTSEKLVDEVLDAVELRAENIDDMYRRWKAGRDGKDKPVILDPACGSGSFLIRAIRRIFSGIRQVYGKCTPDIAQFIEDAIVGIDINPFAVEMAKLNILLALSEEMDKCGMKYLPRNIKVYWADSLAVVKVNTNVLGAKIVYIKIPTLAHVLGKEGDIPVPLLPNISSDELINRIYESVSINKSVEELLGELEKHVGAESIKRAEGELRKLYDAMRKIEEAGNARIVELVKNASIVASLLGKCNYVVGNPPWVRIHRVAPSVMKTLRENYVYFKPGSAYDPKFKKTKTPFKEQHDYSLAFVERGLQFLRESGVLGYVITSKVLKAMYAGKMREDILSNHTILELRDYSLHPVPLFQDAVNYPLVLAVKKEKPAEGHWVKVCITNTVGDVKCFTVPQSELPLDKGDKKSPWLIAPLDVIQAFRKIQSSSMRLGDIYEVTRGVETSADGLFVVEKVVTCSGNIARVYLANGTEVNVEVDLLNPFVRGRDVDPFGYGLRDLVIFTHDTATLNPLWNNQQRRVLQLIGVLGSNVDVTAIGRALVYTLETSCTAVTQRVQALDRAGFQVRPVLPCAVNSCFDVFHDGKRLLRLSLEAFNNVCRVYVEGLEIPGHPAATTHILNNLSTLVSRRNYRANLPPWCIFAIWPDKFRDYRIAWQEIAKHFEACYLPVKTRVNICGTSREALLVPNVKVYFIVEPDIMKALKLLIYLNTNVARNLLKLRALAVRGGYYEHQSASVAHLPIPKSLLDCTTWNWIGMEFTKHPGKDLNEVARKLSTEYSDRLTRELINALGISEEEYKKLVDYGRWLNELGDSKQEEIITEEEELEEI